MKPSLTSCRLLFSRFVSEDDCPVCSSVFTSGQIRKAGYSGLNGQSALLLPFMAMKTKHLILIHQSVLIVSCPFSPSSGRQHGWFAWMQTAAWVCIVHQSPVAYISVRDAQNECFTVLSVQTWETGTICAFQSEVKVTMSQNVSLKYHPAGWWGERVHSCSCGSKPCLCFYEFCLSASTCCVPATC